MQVLVAGGTGFIGTHLCPELAKRGHDVTALSRSPDDTDLPAGVETAAADISSDDLEDIVAGHDAVVNLVALSPLFQPRGRSHQDVHVEGTRNLVAASEAAGVERIVQMSALGADPDGTTAYIRAKGEAEDIVRASGLEWVIFRPSVVFGEGGEFVSFTKKLTPPGIAPLPGGGKTKFQPIWVGDLVPLLADAVADDAHVGETYEIGGPEQLTLGKIARMVRKTTVIPVPMALAGIGMSIAGAVPGVPFGPDQYRSLQFDNTTTDNDVTAFGVDPDALRTLADYLAAG
jgi:NADH dehydrogenase